MSIAALSSFENISLLLEPYSNDISAALIITIGYYLYKYINKKENVQEKSSKKNSSQNNLETLNSFNTLILQNEDPLVDAYKILTQMHNAKIHPDITTYNRLIDMSFKFEQDENAFKLFEEVCDSYSGVQPDIVSFNIIMRHYVKEIREFKKYQSISFEKKLEKVLKIFADIKAHDLPLNSITYNTVMDACNEVGDFRKALSLFEEMQSQKIKPDIFTYSILLKGMKKMKGTDNVKKAVEIYEFAKKESDEIKIDEVLYNSILDICITNNELDKAREIFEEMKNGNIIPSVVTYSIMIKGYGNNKNFEKCYELYNELISKKISPNEVIFGSLMNCAVKCSNLELMIEIYQKMKEFGIETNPIIYTTLIKGFSKQKKYQEAFEIYDSMPKEVKEKSCIILYNTILDVCSESENFQILLSIFQELKDEGKTNLPNPNLVTYITVIKGLIKGKRFDEALKIYNELKNTNIRLDEIIFNLMIDGFAEAGHQKTAENLFLEMKKLNVKRTSVIYSILVKMYAKNGIKKEEDLTKATELISLMRADGIKPTIITFTTIMQMYIRKKNIKSAINIFQEIKKEGLVPDVVSYNFIINGCTFNQNLESGIFFLLESINLKMKLSPETYKNTLEYLMNNKFMKYNERVHHASEILKGMKENNIQLNYETYSKVMRLIIKNNEPSSERIFDKGQKFNNYSNSSIYKKY
jgi:pentatricopeptide repeat protein